MSIQAPWFSRPLSTKSFGAAALLALIALPGGLPGRAPAAPASKTKKRAASKPATKQSAAPTRAVGAAGLIAIAQHQLELGKLAEAAEYSNSASQKAPLLDDYAQYIRAQAEYGLKNYAEVANAATRVFQQVPDSPFVGAAAALVVKAQLDGGSPKQALGLIQEHYNLIPQPEASLLLARCFEANNDLAQAAEYYQRVYYSYPTSKEATDAANALVTLKTRLADAYPSPMPSAMLERAKKLFDAKNPAAARIELAAAIPQLTGAERDLASVRLGVADFLAKNTSAAFSYLSALKVEDPEADAERLSYLIRAARKNDRHADVKPFLSELEQHHPESLWRLDALVFVADQARSENDGATYIPLYRACATTFVKDQRSAWCQWRVAYDSYHHDASDAYDLMRKQIEQHPDSQDINNTLYFLGRLQERKNDFASARACYDELVNRFPNTYFAVIGRERLKDPGLQAAQPSPEMVSFLSSVNWPGRPEFPSFEPGDLAKSRIDRAQLLDLTGLNDFAESELKYGARHDREQENVYAYQLAKLATARGAPDQAVRYVKLYTPNYLYMPLDQAPVTFWQYAFPIPYRAAIVHFSNQQSLDPYLVSALIRQESEFSAKVISHANAYGLMQLLPSTGKQLGRHFGMRLSAPQLLDADVNVELGAYYFRNLLNSYAGQTEIALASYNAGPGRANLWRTWGPFREPAEFIETIPFHETRGYVQIVLRNADLYRRLYGSTVPDVPSYHPKPPPKATVKKRRSVRHR